MERFEENSRKTKRVEDVQAVLAYLTLPIIERPDAAQLAQTESDHFYDEG